MSVVMDFKAYTIIGARQEIRVNDIVDQRQIPITALNIAVLIILPVLAAAHLTWIMAMKRSGRRGQA